MSRTREESNALTIHEELTSCFDWDEDDRIWMSIFPADEDKTSPEALHLSLDGAAFLAAKLLKTLAEMKPLVGEPEFGQKEVDVFHSILKRLAEAEEAV